MPAEFWGTLSVRDHLNAQALVADLLLYDRLVFPTFSGHGERTRWRREGWAPELQEGLIEQLGPEVAIRAEWDEQRQRQYRDWRSARKEIAEDPWQSTRRILAMDQDLQTPESVTVRAIAAYHDADEAQQDFELTIPQPDNIALGQLAFVVSRELLIPIIQSSNDDEDLVLRARDLSLDPIFRAKRAAFYAWMEDGVDRIAKGRASSGDLVADLRRQADELNQPIRTYFAQRGKVVATRAVFTLVGIAMPFALGINPATLLAAIPGAYELVRFGAEHLIDARTGERAEAAAMIAAAKPLGKGVMGLRN